jgi:hypothetical protein
LGPRIFLNKLPVNMVHRLSKIVIKHGGRLVSSDDDATHVIDWNDDSDLNYSPVEKAESASKVLSYYSRDVPDDHFIVHSIYFPNSYNEVVPVKNHDGSLTADSVFCFGDQLLKKKYYLSCRYLLDCESFNEWGHELDYEIPSIVPAEEDEVILGVSSEPASTNSNRGRGRGRKRNSSTYSIQTKILRETFIPQMISSTDKFASELPASLSRLCPPGVVAMNLSDANRVQWLPLQDLFGASVFVSSSRDEGEEADSLFSKKSKKNLADCVIRDNTVDGCGGTSSFSLSSISDLERKYLHYLLSYSPVETVADVETNYVQIRNAIVNLYLLNKNQYLTGTECRRKIAGDISTILRIHEFLDAFGVINNAVKLECCPRYLMEDFNHLTVKRRLIHQEMLEKCSSIYGKGNFFSDNDCGHEYRWSYSLDQFLLSTVSESHCDWKDVAALCNEFLHKEHQISARTPMVVTTYDCMVRFLELSLLSMNRARDGIDSVRSVFPEDLGHQFPIGRYMQQGSSCPVFKVRSTVNYFTKFQKELASLTTSVSLFSSFHPLQCHNSY